MKNRTIEEELSYREALTVIAIKVYRNGSSFPICPKCDCTMEREYQSFCDRCGQKLKWRGFSKAKIRL